MKNDIIVFKNEITNIISNIFPESKNFNININSDGKIDEYIKEFDRLEDIYDSRERYKLEWAYEYAQSTFNRIHSDMEEFILNKVKNETRIFLRKVKEYLNQDKKIKKDIKFNFGLFSYAKVLVSVIELILSVILIIFISNMSHSTESMIENHNLAIIVVISFALIKIFLEKQGLGPKIERYGWSLYEKTLQEIKSNIIVGIIMVDYFEEISNDEEKLDKLMKYIDEDNI